MSLRQMEYLVAVVEEGSFTRAAQRAGVSQATLSHQVRELERTVGQPLLERLPGAVLLTPMGRAYLPHAAAALRSAREARRAVGPRAEPARLRIATLFSIALGILPPAIRAWGAEHPEVEIEVRDFPNLDELTAHMALGVADLAVGPRPRAWPGTVRVIGTEQMVVVLGADDPLARAGTLRLAELADRPWILYAPENALARLVERACEAAGFTPRAAVHTRHTATAVSLAAAGLGAALAPESIIEADLDAAVLRPDPPVRRELVALGTPGSGALAEGFVDLLAARGADGFRR
jgi:DNA-binding transcriptional LysR family regulator